MFESLLNRLNAPNIFIDFLLNAGANAIGTILGGIFLTIVYYFFGRQLFKSPNLNGLWAIGSTFNRTKYNPFRNMQLIYKVHILQDGNRIFGTGEKVIERAAVSRYYVGKDRQPLEIQGTIEKKYWGRSQVSLHIKFQGELRSTSGYAQLNCIGFGRRLRLEGLMSMTAGDSYGTAVGVPLPINLIIDEYQGLPLTWVGRVINFVAGNWYPEDWKLVEDRVKAAERIVKIVWCKYNFHLPVAALVLAEDERFYRHGGVDPIGIFRALFRYLLDRRVEGTSTIEQQFVRVATGDYRRSFGRKWKEIVLATRLHRIANKQTIALHYLLVAYGGWQMTGVLRSARHLNIDLAQPSLADAAAIVAHIKYPQPRFPGPTRTKQIANRKAFILSKLQERPFLIF